MRRTKSGDMGEIAEVLRGEATEIARGVHKLLFSETPPDEVELSQREFVDYVRRNWHDEKFRADLLERLAPASEGGERPEVGLKNYFRVLNEAFNVKIDPDNVPEPPPDAAAPPAVDAPAVAAPPSQIPL